MIELKREELLISQLADLLINDKHIAVGAASPIPGAAALLAKQEAKIQNNRLRVTILHSNKYNNLPNFVFFRNLWSSSFRSSIFSFNV